MNLTKHFTRQEFDCNDGTPVPAQYMSNVIELAKQLEVLRTAVGNKPININSGYRTPTYNATLKGAAKDSQHLQAKAADITIQGLTALQVYNIIEKLIAQGKMKQGGLGLYDTFVHYDIRGNASRLNLTKKKVKQVATQVKNISIIGTITLLALTSYLITKKYGKKSNTKK